MDSQLEYEQDTLRSEVNFVNSQKQTQQYFQGTEASQDLFHNEFQAAPTFGSRGNSLNNTPIKSQVGRFEDSQFERAFPRDRRISNDFAESG